jgi:carboxyl-terminal processing protease
MPRCNLGWLVGIAGFFLLADVVVSALPKQDAYYKKMPVLVEVLKKVEADYERELTDDEKNRLIEDMINGGLERLDPHSAYIAPREWRQFSDQTEGEFGGIGVQIEPGAQNGGQLTVVSPVPGTPAYDAGVQAGDLIVKIDGKVTETMKVNDAVDLIKGKEGEKVVLTVRHEGEKDTVDIEITRAKIKIDNVLGDRRRADSPEDWDFFVDHSNKIGYIRLLQFSKPAPKELEKVVKKLQDDGARALILDLRGNPGGLLEAACDIADTFLTDGVIVTVKGRNHKEEVYTAKEEGTLMTPAEKFPMVVLIDRGSASASEIVSAALQDHKRAVVIGERSYGKGSVQNLIRLEGGTSRLKLTTARYWRPSGKNIHRDLDSKDSDEWGVMPDIVVPLKREERTAYLNYRRERDKVQGKDKSAPKSEPDLEKDKVLKKALDHLSEQLVKQEK